MNVSNAPISFPGLFGDWQFTVPSKALDIGNGIYWYGIIIAAGMLLGLYFCMKQAPKYGLSEDNIIDTVLWVIPFSIIGARISGRWQTAACRDFSSGRPSAAGATL